MVTPISEEALLNEMSVLLIYWGLQSIESGQSDQLLLVMINHRVSAAKALKRLHTDPLSGTNGAN